MICIISFTENGKILAEKIKQISSYNVENFTSRNLKTSISQWAKEAFFKYEAIIFIGATAIAVRLIAPYLKDKTKDPAVIVIDEKGNFVIPILSGHIGGANELAMEMAKKIHAQPVITTATDINKKFAVDVWCKNHNLFIEDMKAAKLVSCAILDEKAVGFTSDFLYKGDLPHGIYEKNCGKIGINISIFNKSNIFDTTLNIVPKIVHVGIGCKKNTCCKSIENTFIKVINNNNLKINSIASVSSIDLKKDEKGLLEFCNKYAFKSNFYSSSELNNISGKFTKSNFVKQITGTDNVCERASIKASGGKLLVSKQSYDGVTIAISVEDFIIEF